MRSILCGVALVLFSAVLARGQALADRVPEDALIYVGWSGGESMGPGYSGSHLKALLDASNISQLFQEAVPKLLDEAAKHDPDVSKVREVLEAVGAPMWKHPTALFFSGVEMNAGGPPMPHLGVICQAGADATALHQQLETLLKQAPADQVPMKVEQADDVVMLTIGYAEGQSPKPVPGAKSLKGQAGFTKALGQVGKDPVVVAYADVRGLTALADKLVQQVGDPDSKQTWPKLRDALGLASVERAIWTQGFSGKEWESAGFIAMASGGKGGMAGMLSAQPLSDSILLAVPQSATTVGASHFDVSAFVSSVEALIRQMDPNAGHEMDSAIASLNKNLGMDLQADVLATLGDEWAYYSDPGTGGVGLLGIAVVNRLKDAAKAEASLTKLAGVANTAISQQLHDPNVHIVFRETKSGDLTIHYLAVPLVTPAWAVQNGNLYLGLYPQVVAAAAAQVSGKNKSILDNKDFVALRKRLGGDRASALQFLDLPKSAANAYQNWLMIFSIARFGDVFGVQTPASLLPRLSDLQQHLSPAGAVTWSDADGWHMRGLSPFPGSEILASDLTVGLNVQYTAVMMSVLLPSLSRGREQAHRIQNASNLRQIGMGALAYANDHQGSLPDNLGEITKLVPAAGAFVNSNNNSTAPHGLQGDALAKWVDEHADYVWLGRGLKTSDIPPDRVLAHEKLEGAREGVNMLFADGHVEWVALRDVPQRLGKPAPGAPKAPPLSVTPDGIEEGAD